MNKQFLFIFTKQCGPNLYHRRLINDNLIRTDGQTRPTHIASGGWKHSDRFTRLNSFISSKYSSSLSDRQELASTIPAIQSYPSFGSSPAYFRGNFLLFLMLESRLSRAPNREVLSDSMRLIPRSLSAVKLSVWSLSSVFFL